MANVLKHQESLNSAFKNSPEIPVIYLSQLREYFTEQEQVMSPSQCAEVANCIAKLIPA
jgi:hypothetical protein